MSTSTKLSYNFVDNLEPQFFQFGNGIYDNKVKMFEYVQDLSNNMLITYPDFMSFSLKPTDGKKMIALSGFVADKDIQIKITGLRPGEKLHEELLNNKELVLPTYNDKIMIAKIQEYNYEEVNHAVSWIVESVDKLSKHDLVAHMKHVFPEFLSMNSEHFRLDKNSKPSAFTKTRPKKLKVLIN